MNISAADVNKLRQQTGAGLMDCKKALIESKGDFEAAIDFLRKKGQKVSESRAGRDAVEGAVIAMTNADETVGYIVHISCETDFVAKNDDFVNFAQSIADLAVAHDAKTGEELLSLDLNGLSVKDRLIEQVGRIGEKIGLVTFERIEGEMVIPYIHAGNRIGVLVSLNKAGANGLKDAGRDVAMQVAAMKPIALDRDDVPIDVVEREMEIGREIARSQGKPEQIIDKIAEGKVNKFMKDFTLVNQDFVKDSGKTVGGMLKEVDKDAKITGFRRVALG